MTRTTPELAPPLQTSAPNQREDAWPPTYDLAYNKINTQQIFNEIGFRTWNPLAPEPRPYHWAIVAFEKTELISNSRSLVTGIVCGFNIVK
ncbi:hypothetical protein AVEN_124001-1 [Araneus ventricosus]|uniref:Uncharacterized protein n=1 Tax=Araneus ventricosus TaxID=182803 RepID=A0A4Y2D9W3_ARAVE|nr:hypothetical protein AVEN_124001-1 [Araneus ventricosus]